MSEIWITGVDHPLGFGNREVTQRAVSTALLASPSATPLAGHAALVEGVIESALSMVSTPLAVARRALIPSSPFSSAP